MIKLCKDHAINYLEELKAGESFMVEYTEHECERCRYGIPESKSGVGLIVYYQDEKYYSEWYATIREAYDTYYDTVAKDMIHDAELDDMTFEHVTVKLVYSYGKFMSEIREGL